MILKLVIRNLGHRKARTGLTILGVVLGVGAIVSLVSISEGLRFQAYQFMENLQGITVSQAGSIFPADSRIPREYAAILESIPGVELVAARIEDIPREIDGFPTRFDMFGEIPVVMGIEPSKIFSTQASIFSRAQIKGRHLTDHDRYAAMLGRQLAEKLGKQLGSKIQINGYDLRIVGIFDTGSPWTNQVILVPIDSGYKILGRDPKYVSSFWILIRDPSTQALERMARRIELKLDGVVAETPLDVVRQFEHILKAIQTGSWAVTGIAGIVGGIGILNSMLMSVMERRREIGVMKAVGWSNLQVMKLFLMEALMIAILGGMLGICLGFLGMEFIRSHTNFPALITPQLVMQAMGFALALGMLGGIYPAWRSSRILPAEALRYE